MLGTKTGVASVYRSTDAGQTWKQVVGTGSTSLPLVPSYSMVIDPRPTFGANGGHIYVGTDVGAYVSIDNGQSWSVLGQGLPPVPVVDLQLNTTQETLAAATQGRGVFTLSTATKGPFITGARREPGDRRGDDRRDGHVQRAGRSAVVHRRGRRRRPRRSRCRRWPTRTSSPTAPPRWSSATSAAPPRRTT